MTAKWMRLVMGGEVCVAVNVEKSVWQNICDLFYFIHPYIQMFLGIKKIIGMNIFFSASYSHRP